MPVMSLPGPKARALIKRDQAVISPSYPRGYPFVMDHGNGTEVWDVDGNRFLDFASGIAVVATGHSHPKVVKAIQEQAEKFIHISSDFYHPKWIELGEKLNEIAPFLENAVSFMTNSGTESVEAAIKLARNYTRRSQFIGFLGAFHGLEMHSPGHDRIHSPTGARFCPDVEEGRHRALAMEKSGFKNLRMESCTGEHQLK